MWSIKLEASLKDSAPAHAAFTARSGPPPNMPTPDRSYAGLIIKTRKISKDKEILEDRRQLPPRQVRVKRPRPEQPSRRDARRPPGQPAASATGGFRISTVETVLSRRIDDLEPQLTRHGYDVRALCDQFDAKPAEIRQLLRGNLNPQRSAELIDEMRAAGLPL